MKLTIKTLATLMTFSVPFTAFADTPPDALVAESADAVAKKLANPNTPLATLNTKFQFRTYEGDLPGADDVTSTTMLIQPSFPFKLDNGDTVFWRPALPIEFDRPVYEGDGASDNWGESSGIGDLSFDLAYGMTEVIEDGALVSAYGIFSSVAIGNDDLTSDTTTLGPEMLFAKLGADSVYGILATHSWDIDGDATVNTTTAQLIWVNLPGGGWNYGTAPNLAYDHENDQWTIPVNVNVGKTVIFNGRPWKMSVALNYYVEKNDDFAPDFMIEFTIGPVVENVLAGLFN